MAKRVSTPSWEAVAAANAFREEQHGNFKHISLKLGISKQAISGWRAIPAEWVRQLSEVTGMPPWRLRPDLYDAPPSPPETIDAAGEPL